MTPPKIDNSSQTSPQPPVVEKVEDVNKNGVINAEDRVELSSGPGGVLRTIASVSQYIGDGTPAERLARLGSVVSASRRGQTTSGYVSGQMVLRSLSGGGYLTYEPIHLGHNGLITTSTPVILPGGRRTTVGEYVRGDTEKLRSVLVVAGQGGREFGVSGDVIDAAQPHNFVSSPPPRSPNRRGR